ncbi:protein FAR1-RELATED SEQUENCE 5-like isoform X2 [Hordeum vulgare subsp. vulgare]|uniref:protein FAR1-RELATED SEQUENCE 5-like isoform X2 n=1 Tax=Hordeum vulgare subsp. vulgare TaxID=112509 RepID=UPI001D1A333A|nr:protein FAR1-RELATED SEQUENCE 5-like isoform X2 [Hordeum vulgare subsp. vulgare]
MDRRGGKEAHEDGLLKDGILEQYGQFLMGSQAQHPDYSNQRALLQQNLQNVDAPASKNLLTTVQDMDFLEGINLTYTQLLMAASQEGGIGGSQHFGHKENPGGGINHENDMFMLTERYGRLEQDNNMCQTTKTKQIQKIDVGAEGFPSWIWDNNRTEEHTGSSYHSGYRPHSSDDDEMDDELDDDLTINADEAAGGFRLGEHFTDDTTPAGCSHGPSLTDDMSADGDSDNSQQAYTFGKKQNVPQCDDQQDERDGGTGHKENIEQLSQEDILMFLENDSVAAAQTCSQEVRSHHVPHVGMPFVSHEAAYAFYNEYAAICGFAIKKAGTYHASNPGGKAVTRYTFKCNRSGKVVSEDVLEERKKKRQLKNQEKTGVPPPEKVKRKRKNFIEITGCQAKMVATRKGEVWLVTSIGMEHNHTLSPPDESKYLRSHKHMTEQEKLFIRTFNSVQMPTRKIMAILSYLRGGNAPYTKKYVSNVRTTINRENGKSDMLQVLEYFRNKQKEDPNFYYAFKVADEDINKVLCIFWADGYSRKMYELYGDCLSFDTTYKTNRYNLPFAPFVGISGHGLNCLFACAIVNNETVDTFEWLFKTFLDCMHQKTPMTVITDQDVAMKSAIPTVFKGSVHRCCLFHIMKKVQERCVRTFSLNPELYPDFSDIIHNCLTEAEFEMLWPQMTHKYGVDNLKYFRYMWKYRKLFVPVYFKKCFFPFIHSTARSEGTNAIFKDNVGSTFGVVSFLREYQRILEAMQENEKEQDSLTRITKPTYWLCSELELQAANKYNRAIFYRFQKVIKFANQLHVEEVEKNSRFEVYKTRMLADKDFRIRRYVVIVDIHQEDFTCICAKFEKDGLVWSHILRVLMHLNLSVLPEKYYIHIWRPKEKKDIRKLRYGVPEELTAGDHHLRYMLLSSRLNEWASDAASSNEKYMYLVAEGVKIEAKLDEITLAEEQQKMQGKQSEPSSPPSPVINKEHPDGYGENLKDPYVIISKGRPQERYKTFLEKLHAKQQIGCGHCGQHDHVFVSCTNKHIPKSQFHKKTTVGKKTSDVTPTSHDTCMKNQTEGSKRKNEKRSSQKDATSAPSAARGLPTSRARGLPGRKTQTGGKQKSVDQQTSQEDFATAS